MIIKAEITPEEVYRALAHYMNKNHNAKGVLIEPKQIHINEDGSAFAIVSDMAGVGLPQ